MIHPAALIEDGADIAPGVSIGPYAVVERGARIGTGCLIAAHAIICGSVRLGPNNQVGHHAVLGGFPQDLSFDASSESFVEVDSDNVIREFVTIHRGTKPGTVTRLGRHNFLMAGAHVGHNGMLGNSVILANNVLLGGYAEIEDRAFLGGAAVVHQFTRIGTGAILQGQAAVSQDVPPFTSAAGRNSIVGLNVIGLRRAGFDPQTRTDLKEAFQLLYRSGQTFQQAIRSAGARDWQRPAEMFWSFVRASKRGICAYQSWSSIKSQGHHKEVPTASASESEDL